MTGKRLGLAAVIALMVMVTILSSQGFSVRADDDPLTWQIFEIPGLPDGARPREMWTDRPRSLYVWTEVSSTDPNVRAAYLYHWDGSTWTQELSVPGYFLGRIFGTGPDDIFASVSCYYDYCSGYTTPRMYHFDGMAWTEQVLPAEVGSFIRSIGGAPGEVQAVTFGQPNPSPNIIIRYDYDSETWGHLYTTPEGARNLIFVSADEAYYETCWGHGRWNGTNWTYKHEFDFCDVYDLWGLRDQSDQLHLYAVGNNNFSNGIRVWKYTENTNPALLGTFGSKCGFVFGDPTDGDFICNGVYAIGSARGVWGSAWDDVYVAGNLGAGAEPDSGRVYHYDGTAWQRLTEFGDLPIAFDIWGSGPDDVWISLRDRLLHIGPVNSPPVLSVDQSAVTVDEGQTVTNSGIVSDADGDAVTLGASVGTVTDNGNDTWSWSLPTTDGPAESQSVTITADDGNGGTAQASFSLTVNNVPPTIDAITAPLDPMSIDSQLFGVSVFYSDPGSADTHDVTWEWGDLKSDLQAYAISPATQQHIYEEAGVYEVTLTVADDDGGTDTAVHQFIVIYDPSAGFVTGGGWIASPEGAFASDPTVTGKASFGFVSKYKKGATVPTGNTEFIFHAADLNFHSSSYQWLVVTGSDYARFKGAGAIDGALAPNGEEYLFMIWAGDGTGDAGADTFRIKIWWEEGGTEHVVYDNNMDQAIGGGSIVVHTK